MAKTINDKQTPSANKGFLAWMSSLFGGGTNSTSANKEAANNESPDTQVLGTANPWTGDAADEAKAARQLAAQLPRDITEPVPTKVRFKRPSAPAALLPKELPPQPVSEPVATDPDDNFIRVREETPPPAVATAPLSITTAHAAEPDIGFPDEDDKEPTPQKKVGWSGSPGGRKSENAGAMAPEDKIIKAKVTQLLNSGKVPVTEGVSCDVKGDTVELIVNQNFPLQNLTKLGINPDTDAGVDDKRAGPDKWIVSRAQMGIAFNDAKVAKFQDFAASIKSIHTFRNASITLSPQGVFIFNRIDAGTTQNMFLLGADVDVTRYPPNDITVVKQKIITIPRKLLEEALAKVPDSVSPLRK